MNTGQARSFPYAFVRRTTIYSSSFQSNPDKQFNLHPVLMTTGLIFLYGDGTCCFPHIEQIYHAWLSFAAILVYRVFLNLSKIKTKILHATLLVASLLCASIGLKAVFDSHNLSHPPAANLYSLHSWIGLSTVILFGVQWIVGFIAFLYPKLSEDFRKMYMPR